jgi:hypothetical protein
LHRQQRQRLLVEKILMLLAVLAVQTRFVTLNLSLTPTLSIGLSFGCAIPTKRDTL